MFLRVLSSRLQVLILIVHFHSQLGDYAQSTQAESLSGNAIASWPAGGLLEGLRLERQVRLDHAYLVPLQEVGVAEGARLSLRGAERHGSLASQLSYKHMFPACVLGFAS